MHRINIRTLVITSFIFASTDCCFDFLCFLRDYPVINLNIVLLFDDTSLPQTSQIYIRSKKKNKKYVV